MIQERGVFVEDLVDLALARAREAGASYADVRIVRRERETIEVKNGSVDNVSAMDTQGFGIRVIAEGAWGFASSAKLDKQEILRVAELAVRVARASAAAKKRGRDVTLSPVKALRAEHSSTCKKDPFKIGMEKKVALLLSADRLMRQAPEVKVAQGMLSFMKEERFFASSDGARIREDKVISGGVISATAVRGGEVQKRSYPDGFGDFAAAGYEFIEDLDLEGHAERIAREAVALLDAPSCPSVTTDLVLGGQQLALQVHESCGHPVELDRVLGTEVSLAGASFLTLDKQNKFQYGSPVVNITADATIEGALGSFGFDDEGVPAQRTEIVKEGRFVNYLTSRETAALLGQTSNGAMRADGWNRIPLIRMTNINLEPGDWSLDEIIKDTKDGIYMESNASWSIDDYRLNFQFGTEVAYEIKDGSLGRLLKNPTYTGITPEFWNSCDAVAGKKEWHIWGVSNCGKGEPMQIMQVGHGTAPARFRKVKVGVGQW